MEKLLIDGSIWFVILLWQLYMLIAIIDVIFKLNGTPKLKLSTSVFAAVFCTSFKLIIPLDISILSPILMIVIVSAAFMFFYKAKFFKGCLYAFIMTILTIPIEGIAGYLFFTIFNYTFVTDNLVASIPILLFVNICFTIMSVIIQLVKSKRFSISIDTNAVNNKFIYINIIAIALFVVPNLVFYTLNKYDYPLFLLIYNLFANIFLVSICIYNTYNSIKFELRKRDLENAEMHNKNLSMLIDNIRIFKHDYNNVVHAIGGYISLNDMDGLKKYYSGLLKDSQKVNSLESISPSKIDEPSVYGIIASKYQVADLKGITFSFESMFKFSKIKMPIYDFCKVLGILLDNAIEAAEETTDKKVIVSARENFKDNIQIISIENTYKDKEIDIDKIFEKEFSTKSRNSGIGLWEVKNIIIKNTNVDLITTKDEKYFKQELIISE